MQLGDIVNEAALGAGKPLDGVRILAIETMQALPFATQLLGRLGADVLKVEPLGRGDLARGSQPAVADDRGRSIGATFLRNNLSKRSIAVDLKRPEGRDLVLGLAPGYDVFAENSRAGASSRLGLGFDDVRAHRADVVYLSVSGFGNTVETPYRDWPAFAPIVEAMSGIYAFKSPPGKPPVVAPVGALGDIGTALFATVGLLAALRQRDRTGEAQYVDIAMLDAMVAMTDIVTNLWSMGLRGGDLGAFILHGFAARDGWFIVQVGREDAFARLADAVGHAEWVDDPRFATRQGWIDNLDGTIRPAIEHWAAAMTKVEASAALSAAGVAAGPCFADEEVVADEHVAARDMLVECRRDDGVDQPILVPGNPVRIAGVAQGPERRVPWLGEHTDAVLTDELHLPPARIADLRSAGVVG